MISLTYNYSAANSSECEAFANKTENSTSSYISGPNAARNASDGKLGEMCAYQLLRTIMPDLDNPDSKTYKSGEKTFGPDMCSPGTGISLSIKSQTLETAKYCGESYTLEWGSHSRLYLGNHPSNGKIYGLSKSYDKYIFNNDDPHHYVVGVLLDKKKQTGTIRFVVKAHWLLRVFPFDFPENYKSILDDESELTDDRFYDFLRNRFGTGRGPHTKAVISYQRTLATGDNLFQIDEIHSAKHDPVSLPRF